MTSVALLWRALAARPKLPALLHGVRVDSWPRRADNDDDLPNSSFEAARVSGQLASGDLVMSSSSGLISGDVELSEDQFRLQDVARARAVRQLRVVAVAVALVPLSCLCVVVGIWTSSDASVTVTRSQSPASDINSSSLTIILTLCCTRLHPSSSPPVDCWISSDLDCADVQGVDAQLDADDDQLGLIWRNVSASFGCSNVLFPNRITPVNLISENGTASTSYCVNVYCNATVNSSLSKSTDMMYGGQIKSSSTTTWIVSGLTALIALAVVGMACLLSTASRFHKGRLRTAVAEARVAQARRRSAAVEKYRCDRLLADMLPSGVAERLKMSQTVDPESFDIASIYFSDIVGFNDVALNCESPLVIVRLLSSVFRYLRNSK